MAVTNDPVEFHLDRRVFLLAEIVVGARVNGNDFAGDFPHPQTISAIRQTDNRGGDEKKTNVIASRRSRRSNLLTPSRCTEDCRGLYEASQ